MLGRIKAVIDYTMVDEIRNKVFNATVLFAALCAYLSLVLTRLAQGYEERFMRDLCFAMLELFGLVIALQSAYRVVNADMQRGSGMDIFFVRPIRRWEFLVGRFLGLACLLFVALAVMMGVLMGFMAVGGFSLKAVYAVIFAQLFFKLWIVLGLASLIACVTTSQASYLVAVLLLFSSGHVNHLLRKLTEEEGGSGLVGVLLVRPLTYLLPNFSLFALINNIDAPLGTSEVFAQSAYALAYALVYGAAALALASVLFSRKEVRV